ncbi:MAG: response regulator transcription factor [Bdellovibrionales bacterium]
MAFVFLVEDENKLAQSIGDHLRLEGFLFDHCARYEDVLPCLRALDRIPGVLVLDRLLFGQDSLPLIEDIRAEFPEMGILILSAIGSPQEKASAIDRGADDYLAKPFAFAELVARIRSLDRRNRRTSPHVRMGNVTLDEQNRCLLVDGQKMVLTNKEFLLLRLLVRHPGRVFSKATVLESVWEVSADSESNVVEATVNSVRKKLREAVASIEVKNMRNVGYWLED